MVCGRLINFRNGRKFLTLLTFGYPFISFSFENDLSPLLFELIKQRYIRRMRMFGKSDIRLIS